MWLVTTRGFYSLIAHRTLEDKMILRARVKGDLTVLEDLIPDMRERMWRDASADYPWRAIVMKDEAMLLMARLVGEIDYGNFKSAVGRRQGRKREGIYHRVWDVLTDLEPGFRKRYYRGWKGYARRDDEFTGFDPLPTPEPLFESLFEDIQALPETIAQAEQKEAAQTRKPNRRGSKKKESKR